MVFSPGNILNSWIYLYTVEGYTRVVVYVDDHQMFLGNHWFGRRLLLGGGSLLLGGLVLVDLLVGGVGGGVLELLGEACLDHLFLGLEVTHQL